VGTSSTRSGSPMACNTAALISSSLALRSERLL
jgi:hypothetical protein